MEQWNCFHAIVFGPNYQRLVPNQLVPNQCSYDWKQSNPYSTVLTSSVLAGEQNQRGVCFLNKIYNFPVDEFNFFSITLKYLRQTKYSNVIISHSDSLNSPSFPLMDHTLIGLSQTVLSLQTLQKPANLNFNQNLKEGRPFWMHLLLLLFVPCMTLSLDDSKYPSVFTLYSLETFKCCTQGT